MQSDTHRRNGLPSRTTPSPVVIVAPGELFGGAERQILTLLSGLCARGISTRLCVFHDTELATRARELGIYTEVIQSRGRLDFESLRTLQRFLRSSNPRAIHVHGYRAAFYCALALPAGKFPVVKTEHGGVEARSARLRDRLLPALYHRLEAWAGRHLRAHVVYVTDDLRVSNAHARRVAHSSVIYNGITPLDRAATQRPAEYHADQANIAIVGRLEPVKGIEYAIRALTLAAMPSSVRLHIVGTGPLREELEALAKQLGVAERVRFAGFRSNVYDFIAHADALLMPSMHEGLPYTVLEAMSLGTPVLATRVGGLAEVLTDERTALLFEPANEAAIASAIAQLLGSPALRASLITQANAECASRFSADTMTARYLELFSAPPLTAT